MGRLFVQFIALCYCYYEYFSRQLRLIKQKLQDEITAAKNDAATIQLQKKLLSRLKNTPMYLILPWFDVIETIQI